MLEEFLAKTPMNEAWPSLNIARANIRDDLSLFKPESYDLISTVNKESVKYRAKEMKSTLRGEGAKKQIFSSSYTRHCEQVNEHSGDYNGVLKNATSGDYAKSSLGNCNHSTKLITNMFSRFSRSRSRL